jgi:hypothetical protein
LDQKVERIQHENPEETERFDQESAQTIDQFEK